MYDGRVMSTLAGRDVRGGGGLYVEYRSMGESPDISGAWNVAVRERERE